MSTRNAVWMALIGGAALAAGCHGPGGALMSYTGGTQTYLSYETRPVTVTLVDCRNDQVLFRMDVPAGQQLTVDFLPGEGDDPIYTPDLMRYQVWSIGTRVGRLRNSLTVPAAHARRLDVEYREGEYASRPPEQELRADEMIDRPAWWTPEGGPLPADDKGVTRYDG